VLIGTLGLLGYWRDEGPADLQPPLISSFVGLLPWWAWLIIALAVLMIIVVEGSYRIVAQADPELLETIVSQPEIALEDMGKLDYVPEYLRALKTFTNRLRGLTRRQGLATRLIDLHNARFERTENPLRRQRIARDIARIIDRHNEHLEKVLPEMRDRSQRFMFAMRGFVKDAEINTSGDYEALQGLRESTVVFADSLNGSADAVTSWRGATMGLRGRNISAAINRACDRMEQLLLEYASLYQRIQDDEREVMRAIDVRLKEADGNAP
jgi:hypothetical protein